MPRRVGLVAGTVLVMVAAAGCTSSANPRPTPTVAAPVVLDGGALRLDPVDPSTEPPVAREVVLRDLVRAAAPAGWTTVDASAPLAVTSLGRLVLAHVTWGISGGADVPDGSLAWVQLFTDPTDSVAWNPIAVHCLPMGGPWPMVTLPPAAQSREHALVVSATTGAAVMYSGALTGGPCGYARSPAATTAMTIRSVPWVGKGRAQVTVPIPACGAYFSGGVQRPRYDDTFATHVVAPLSAPCHGASTTRVFRNWWWHAPGHAAVGTVCAVTRGAVTLPAVPGCVPTEA